MRILRAGHAACAEAPRDSQGVAAAAVPAAMKRRRLIFTDIDSLPEFSGSVAHRPATATCEGRDRLAQLPTLAQAHQRHEWHWRLPYSERWKILQPPRERRHRPRRTTAPMKTTVVGTATATAPAPALWLASPEP